ncbi:MAG: hypothetical protein AAF798_17845 [Bacteroidota bacterium]
MRQRRRERLYSLLVVLIALVLLGLRFPDFFQTPHRIIEPYGDGLKAYTVIWYHAQYDSTYSHFQGMNYPYGEHVIPAATQPFYSNLIKFISDNFVDISWATIPIINFSLLLGILLSILFLYLILRKLDTPPWYAALVAIGMSFLAPQYLRLTSHYGLAHMEVLPVVLYLLLLWEERPRWQISMALAAVILVFSQIHFYFFAIMVFVISFYFLFRFLRRWDWKRMGWYAWHYGLMVGLPLVFFMLWLNWNDTVDDRTTAPWGFFAYRARWEGLYTSLQLPHWIWLDKNGVQIITVDGEARAYLGLVAVVGVLVLLLRWLFSLSRNPVVQVDSEKQSFLNHLFWSSTAILLFALGYPFIIPGLEGLLDYAGPIKQFRSIGRFAWAFYYGANITIFAMLWHWAKRPRFWRKPILAGALLLLCMEAYYFAYSKQIDLDTIPHYESPDQFTELEGIDFSEFQAILPIPYYNIGSDQYWYPMEGITGQRTLLLSAQTGLPITGGMLTRTSHSQTRKQIQLVQEPYRVPTVLEDYPNNKPLLMVWNDDWKGDYGLLEYNYLRQGATLLYEEKNMKLYSLPLSSFEQRIATRSEGIRRSLAANWLDSVGGFWTNDSLQHFYYESFDSLASAKQYLGTGAFTGEMQDTNVVFEGQLPNQAEKRYEFSVWMYLGEDQSPRSYLCVEERSPYNNDLWNYKTSFVHRNVKVFDGNWGLVQYSFKVTSSVSKLRFYLYNPDLEGQPIYLDELFIWKTGKEALFEKDGVRWHNNRHFSF